jgi:hypothetical protein
MEPEGGRAAVQAHDQLDVRLKNLKTTQSLYYRPGHTPLFSINSNLSNEPSPGNKVSDLAPGKPVRLSRHVYTNINYSNFAYRPRALRLTHIYHYLRQQEAL